MLGLLGAPRVVRAQASAVTLVGRVVGPDDSPLADASVSVWAVDDLASHVALTSATGRYRVVAPRRAAAFFVAVRKAGYVTQTRQVAGSATDSMFTIADFRMAPSAQALAAVRVVASRPPPVREQERTFAKPGESEYTLDASSGFASALTGDASGDLQLALGGIPSIAVTPGLGGSTSYSIAALDGDQNRVTLNGADVGLAAARDGGLLRVTTSGYDPTEAMSGVRTEWIILGANYVPNRRLRLTFDAPGLQASDRIATAPGPRSAAPVLSGVFGGPGQGFLRFHNTMFQLSRRTGSVATLASIDDAALGALGVSPDSVRLLVGALDGLGIRSLASQRAIDRVMTSGSAYARLDFTTNSIGSIFRGPNETVGGQSNGNDQGHVFYLLLGGNAAESRGVGADALTLPAHATSSRSHGFTAQAFNSVYPREFILNETRISATIGGSRSEPNSPLPAAAVLTSASDDQGGTLATLHAAGSGGATNTMRSWTLQARNDTHLSSPGGRHQWKAALETQVDGISVRREASRGQFEFGSVEDFLARRASAFSRSIAATSTDVRGVHVAAALGDVYTPSRTLAWQYGIRLEGHGVHADAARNRVVDSLFGARTGGLPMRFSVAPMAGFTWRYKLRPSGYPSPIHLIMGGIRDYRGALPTQSSQALFAETGLTSGLREVRCIDDATPSPEWERYGEVAAIPEACAVAGSVDFAQSAQPVSLYSSDFKLGHSVRAELQWMAPISRTVHLSVRAMTAVNTSQPSTVDLNFAGVSRFSLVDEGNRPVFASPTNVGGSGLTSTVESRRYTQFSHVSERRSDLRSSSSSLTGELRTSPVISRFGSGIKVPLWFAYTFTDTREQTTGFTGFTGTAGDPRAIAWQPATSSRHAVLLGAKLHIPDWFDLVPGLILRSGVRYTPMVQGDVNGDGLANDRAFVFDPRATSDGELRAAVSELLDHAPAHAARCLRDQLGRVGAPNSCTGPWTATLNANVVVDPARIRLQNRGALQLRVVNILAGLDQLAHGDRLHGWGQSAYPDPALLRVRGFDPVARRYRYTVNRSFGDTRVQRTLFHSPFRIAIELALDVGPSQERVWRTRALACGSARISGPCPESSAETPTPPSRPDSATLAERLRRARDPRTLFDPVIRRADEFALTPRQIDSLEVLGRVHHAFRDSTYDALAGFVATRGGRTDDEEVERRWRESIGAVARYEWQTGARVRALLTPAQAERIFDRSGPLSVRPIIYDERELERTLRLWRDRVY